VREVGICLLQLTQHWPPAGMTHHHATLLFNCLNVRDTVSLQYSEITTNHTEETFTTNKKPVFPTLQLQYRLFLTDSGFCTGINM